jgi:hypothetical protein
MKNSNKLKKALHDFCGIKLQFSNHIIYNVKWTKYFEHLKSEQIIRKYHLWINRRSKKVV